MKYRRIVMPSLFASTILVLFFTCVQPNETAKETTPALTALSASSGTLEPAFSRDVLAYSLTVGNGVSSVTVTPTAKNGTASISVNDKPCLSGQRSSPIDLSIGENLVRVSVNGDDKTYEISITRARAIPLLTLDFAYGEDGTSGCKNIYVAWIEDLSGNVIQNLVVCNRLVGVGGALTNTALPYWKTKRYDAEQVKTDAVTGATKAKRNFTVVAELRDPTVTAFKVRFETDRSYDANDWFTDQPALLYSATVNLAEPKRSYPLALEAWTANEGTMSSLKEWLGTLSVGSAQTELRFVTNAKNASSSANPPFGDPAPETSATCFVRKITLTVE